MNEQTTVDLDLWQLYRNMLYSRRFEEAVIGLWEEGKISGEMHMGMGEEAICAGIVCQMVEGDAMALDHRGTPPMLMRGVDPVLLLKEFLGRADGLCSGKGGHMHLFSKEHLAASSGIVGAAGPAACGFAMANQELRPDTAAVAFFGDGAMNQGMLLEAMNLASAWKLPVMFVCKDNDWAITTRSSEVTGGDLSIRARAFGMETFDVVGNNVEAVWKTASMAFKGIRSGNGPAFIHARCVHLEGHFLGDPFFRIARHPVRETKKYAGPLLKSVMRRKGAKLKQRAGSLSSAVGLISTALKDKGRKDMDPLENLPEKLKTDEKRYLRMQEEVVQEVARVVEEALK